MEYITVRKEGAVATVTLNRPQALNALNKALLLELGEALGQLETEEDIAILVLTGAGKAFVAGADVGEMEHCSPLQAKAFSQLGNAVFAQLRHSKKITIAAIHGFALGGGMELALACDLRYASETTKFSFPEVGLGIIPGFGGTQMLPRVVGYSKAMELILTNKMLTGAEAKALGLVNDLYSEEELLQSVMQLAQSLGSKSIHALQQGKIAMQQGMEMPLSQGLAMETEAFALTFHTPQQQEAMANFRKK